MTRRVLACLLCGVCVLSLSVWHAPERAPIAPLNPKDAPPLQAQVEFKRDILPILSSKCFACHGPDSSARKAGLRLDQREHALKKARSGAAPIVPGKIEESELVRRIFSEDDDERMPPRKTGKSLSDREKELLRRWIADGAEYQLHWAFVKPERPQVPGVKNQAWVRNPIDAFILHRLEQAGLQPSPQADPATLIRRLSLDLIGLPPTLDEVDEFVKEASARPQAAVEKAVNRLLASPHFGEKMALAWLDLARYGDTSGYHMDSTRQMWLWRDWVIDAFNRDMPFDQFTIEQLAGDLLPNAQGQPSLGLGQLIATGFNRNTRFNEEGGVDPEEYVIRYNVDRTNTLGAVWLGLTLGCAECHSHKYDPISHKEYYQLFAYFSGIKETMAEGLSVHGKPLPPLLELPTPEQTKALKEQHKMLAVVEKAIAKAVANFSYADPLEGKPLPEKISAELAGRSQRAWEAQAQHDDKLPAALRDALKIEPAARSDKQKNDLREHYLRKVHTDARDTIGLYDRDFEEITSKIKEIKAAIPYTLITEEMANPRPAYILERGDFQRRKERVERGVPASLPPLPKDAPPNRLGLARWLVSPEHPLTARVTANRLWAQMFGDGIVRSLGDFGAQGDYPSHPELLDWLAVEFRQGDKETRRQGDRELRWSVKHLLRTIALSATYQQSSVYRKDAVKIDPHNRMLSFAPRHRLAAEELRDSALAISGLLNRKIGGPSFLPYQPKDYYRFKNEDWPWTPSAGDEQYRRGLYAFWRRTALHPMFVTFDAPTREECAVARLRTNTPLQALVTLNDPTFVEAARVFAQRILTQGPRDHDPRLAFAFKSATARFPSPTEMQVLRARFEQQRARFARDRHDAERFINVGQYPRDARLDVSEFAAWTALCNMILNLDEVLTRE